MRKIFSLGLLSGLLFISSCNNKGSETKTDKDSMAMNNKFDAGKAKTSLEELNKQFTSAFLKGDTTGMATYYASDGMVLPPNGEFVTGNGIPALWGAFTHMGIKDFKLTIHDVEGNNEYLIETGNYELTGNDGKTMDKGKYVVVWKNENGNWKIFRDIFNTNLPPVPAAP